MIIIGIIIGIIVGVVPTYLILHPRYIQRIEFNEQNSKKNIKIQKELDEKEKKLSQLSIQIKELNNSFQALSEQSRTAADSLYKSSLELAQTNLEHSLEEESKKYTDCIEDYQKQLLDTQEECTVDFLNKIQQYKNEIENLKENIQYFKSINDAVVETYKREEQKKQEADFYRLQISEADLIEIKSLREISYKLRNPEALNKVIWKMYFEKATNDLINRVIGSQISTGIYKITNIENGMCYVGQAVDLASRWKQHIKRGLGAEPQTRNKLYPAMMSIGVENFSFEVIEKCKKEELNEREDYYQDFYKAKEYGYSIK